MADLYKIESSGYVCYALASNSSLALTKALKRFKEDFKILGDVITITLLCTESNILKD